MRNETEEASWDYTMQGSRARRRKRGETQLSNFLCCLLVFLPNSSPPACCWLKTCSGCGSPFHSPYWLPNADHPPVAWPKVPTPPASPGPLNALWAATRFSAQENYKCAGVPAMHVPACALPACLVLACQAATSKQLHTWVLL